MYRSPIVKTAFLKFSTPNIIICPTIEGTKNALPQLLSYHRFYFCTMQCIRYLITYIILLYYIIYREGELAPAIL